MCLCQPREVYLLQLSGAETAFKGYADKGVSTQRTTGTLWGGNGVYPQRDRGENRRYTGGGKRKKTQRK